MVAPQGATGAHSSTVDGGTVVAVVVIVAHAVCPVVVGGQRDRAWLWWLTLLLLLLLHCLPGAATRLSFVGRRGLLLWLNNVLPRVHRVHLHIAIH